MLDTQQGAISAKMPQWVWERTKSQPTSFDIDAVGTLGLPELGTLTLVLVSEDKGQVQTFELSETMAEVLVNVIRASFKDL